MASLRLLSIDVVVCIPEGPRYFNDKRPKGKAKQTIFSPQRARFSEHRLLEHIEENQPF